MFDEWLDAALLAGVQDDKDAALRALSRALECIHLDVQYDGHVVQRSKRAAQVARSVADSLPF